MRRPLSVLRWTSLALVTAAVAGCMVGPDYKRPETPTTAKFAESASNTSATQPSTQPVVPVDLTRWWRAFDDATLNSLVDRAVHDNLDLRAATARIREARALRGGA